MVTNKAQKRPYVVAAKMILHGEHGSFFGPEGAASTTVVTATSRYEALREAEQAVNENSDLSSLKGRGKTATVATHTAIIELSKEDLEELLSIARPKAEIEAELAEQADGE